MRGCWWMRSGSYPRWQFTRTRMLCASWWPWGYPLPVQQGIGLLFVGPRSSPVFCCSPVPFPKCPCLPLTCTPLLSDAAWWGHMLMCRRAFLHNHSQGSSSALLAFAFSLGIERARGCYVVHVPCRVANELGACQPIRAKHAAHTAIALTSLSTCLLAGALLFFRCSLLVI